ncbi:zinc-dependent peptidase [Lentibacter sp. XHP0401]|uniref:M90 family metallopeptidase n=1 Tax=Lentibacter sp. XHP0401 TaxID=2984334 RepID=UPI0021E7A9BF|nr:M90 family metallopeptidase [Lentibacter sp. XHP0401]MCV2894058.1 zinc-dependent peptidase [Lentibacter sp. XHP0401]
MMYLFFCLVLAGLAAFAFRARSKQQARANLLARPLDDDGREIIAEYVPLLEKLPSELRPKLEGKINLFLDQVQFFGCNGLEVTQEMEFSIAAQAALLVVNMDEWYDDLTTVLIYPSAFKSVQAEHNGYVVTEREIVRTGESWQRGPVILSWQHSEQGADDAEDGHNVVLHEFAHQLDGLSGHTDGAPLLGKGHNPAAYERIFLDVFERHVKNVSSGRRTVIDAYGATGHEELFAVAVEMFFETPLALKADEPEFYDQLAQLFRLDPASWQ